MRFIILLLSFINLLSAANLTVNPAGGGPPNYTTIQACATAMSDGDTCTVYAGTYNENVTVTSGSAGSYKTLIVNGSDTVTVQRFILNSYTKIIGFQIQFPSSPQSGACVAVANGSTSVYVTSNDMQQCGDGDSNGGSMVTVGTGSSHVYFQSNTLSYGCGTPASPDACYGIFLFGGHHLVENNNISHVQLGVVVNGADIVIRNNSFHDFDVDECVARPGCHMDFIFTESDSSNPTQRGLWEGNSGKDGIGGDTKGFLTQADVCGGLCSHVLIRYNTIVRIGSGVLSNDNAGNSGVSGFTHTKTYNNTMVDVNQTNPLYGGSMYTANNSTNGSSINNLFYFSQAMVSFNPYATDASTSATFASGSNLAYCTGSPCNLKGKVYDVGDFLDDPGNLEVDPQFTSYATDNFNLASGSPAVDAGRHLTAVATADTGSGTSLVVDDARFFQDGWGMTAIGVQADWIRIGASTTVQISSINYSTNTITIANAVSRSDGDNVYLYKNSSGTQVLYGSLPDIGALEYNPISTTKKLNGGSRIPGGTKF